MSKSIQLKDKNNNKYYPHPYYPIGSIYLSVNNTNPSRWFGGTWELISQGRTLVGVDTNDTDFNTVQKTGGNKTKSYTPSGNVEGHTLTVNEIPAHNHSAHFSYGTGPYNSFCQGSGKNDEWGASTNTIANTGGGQAHNHGFTGTTSNINVVQPYFTCYIWCRTA